jgi:hypothetical protein
MAVRQFKDRDPDLRLKRIQRRFRAIRNHADRAAKMRLFSRRFIKPMLFGLLIGGAILLAFQFSPWPMGTTIRHLLSRTNCDSARAMGLAPALRGEPGYWQKLDRDNDGIACEPFHPF